MRFVVKKITPIMWENLSSHAKIISFNEISHPHSDRIDYALLIVDEKSETPAGFMTIKEMDCSTAYLQHGGAFPEHINSIHVFPQYMACIAELCRNYEHLWTRIENTNISMLKMAMKAGFRITGTFFHTPKLYLELLMDCRGAA